MSIKQAIATWETIHPDFIPWKIKGMLHGGVNVHGTRILWWIKTKNGVLFHWSFKCYLKLVQQQG